MIVLITAAVVSVAAAPMWLDAAEGPAGVGFPSALFATARCGRRFSRWYQPVPPMRLPDKVVKPNC